MSEKDWVQLTLTLVGGLCCGIISSYVAVRVMLVRLEVTVQNIQQDLDEINTSLRAVETKIWERFQAELHRHSERIHRIELKVEGLKDEYLRDSGRNRVNHT